MESKIKIKASADEMRRFFENDSGVRHYEAIPGGLFSVIYRHAEGHRLSGTYTIPQIEEKRESWRKQIAKEAKALYQ